MRSDHLLLMAACLALAACAGGGAGASSAGNSPDGRIDPQALKVTGEPRTCIRNDSATSTRPAAENVLMFRQSSNTWFRNDLRGACPGLRQNATLLFRNASSRYCEMDSFDVLDPITRTSFGTCVLGKFTPVEVPRGARF